MVRTPLCICPKMASIGLTAAWPNAALSASRTSSGATVMARDISSMMDEKSRMLPSRSIVCTPIADSASTALSEVISPITRISCVAARRDEGKTRRAKTKDWSISSMFCPPRIAAAPR